MMLSSRLVSGPQIPNQGDHVARGRPSLAASKKRHRGSKSSPGAENNSDKKLRSGKSDPSHGVREESGLSFACPFYKWDATIYGGEGGCSSWGNKSLESLIRYHILDKHRKANKARIANGEAHYLDDARFEEVDRLKRTKGAGDSKEEQAENKWKAVYTLLFDISPEARNDVPDPYFKPEAKSNTLGFSLDDLVRLMEDRLADRPSIIPESVDFVREIARLESEQTRQKEKVQTAAAARESQLKTRIREIREQRALQEQQIDAYYHDRISGVRSRYMANLHPGPELPINPYEDPPPLPLFDLGAEFESKLPTAAGASPSQASFEHSTYTRPSILGPSAAETLEQHHSTVTSMTSAPQQLSGKPAEPAYDMDRCGICPTTIADESMWCEECRSLTNLANIR